MLVALPFYFVVGFAIAIFGRRWKTIRNRLTPLKPELALLLGLLAIVLVVVLKIWAENWQLGSDRLALGLGGIAVGAIAGVWFDAKDRDRDRLLFVGASGLFLIAAALEYDRRIFDGLTKIGAGSVSLEFSERGAKVDAPNSSIAVAPDQGGPFPGANRLDQALYYLQNLPEFIFRDEQYAQVFAHPNAAGLPPEQSIVDHLDKPTGAMLHYACKYIKDMGLRLQVLQREYRSNSSILTIKAELVDALRRSFRLRHDLAEMDAAHEPEPGAIAVLNKIASDTDAELAGLFEDLKKKIDVDIQVLTGKKYVRARAKPSGWIENCVDAPDAPLSRAFDAAASEKGNLSGYFGYFALVVGSAEFAAGNREGAFQELQREIVRQTGEFSEHRADLSADNPQDDQKRLLEFRRLLIIARLLAQEDNFFDRSEDLNIDPVRIQTLKSLVELLDLGFVGLDGDDAQAPELFDGDAESCRQKAIDRFPDNDRKVIVARWAVARVVAMSNALHLVGKQPDLARVNPGLEGALDSYAEYLSAFRVNCLFDPGHTFFNGPETGWWVAEAVGSYYESKAGGLDATGASVDPPIRLGLLCKARAAYRKALDYSVNIEPDKKLTAPLDITLEVYKIRLLPVKLKDSINRVSNAMKSFPAGDVEKSCAA